MHVPAAAATPIRFDKLRRMRKYKRNMRKSPTLAALFPDTRAKVLTAAFLQPEKRWYLTEMADFLRTRPSSLQREIDSLVRAGILSQSRDGRRVYLQADKGSPVFADLQALLKKTAGIVPMLRKEILALGNKIKVAFLYGSIARSEEGSQSDIDLMLIGALGLADVTTALRRAERAFGRPINPTVFSQSEFATRSRSRDHFIRTVLRNEKIFLKGDADELEELAR